MILTATNQILKAFDAVKVNTEDLFFGLKPQSIDFELDPTACGFKVFTATEDLKTFY